MTMKNPCSGVVRHVSESTLVVALQVNYSDVPIVLYRIATQPDAGRSVVSRYWGFCRFMDDGGASETELYGKVPSPDPKTQNLWP